MDGPEEILYEETTCFRCGEKFMPTLRNYDGDGIKISPSQPQSPGKWAIPPKCPKQNSASPIFGGLLILIGVIGLAYFALFFDVSVDTGIGERVVNLGLSNDRLVGVIASVGIGIAGILLLAVNQITNRPK
jgi:hypothetical protein